jgi:hypothetical protein
MRYGVTVTKTRECKKGSRIALLCSYPLGTCLRLSFVLVHNLLSLLTNMSLSIPAHNRAIVKKTTGNAVVSDIPVPKLRDGYMLVKTAAVALNPAGWTDVDYDGSYEGCVVGLDHAGSVILPSPTSAEKTFKKGDRICGPVHGCNSAR